MLRDQPRLERRLRALKRTPDGARSLREAVDASVARREQRASSRPRPRLDADLPILAHRGAITEALAEHQVLVVCGETGSGKSTQLPQICLAGGRGAGGLIGHTQPRRIAARTLAGRVSEELGRPLGRACGYKVRFHDRTDADAFIKVMTDGILLAETQGDRRLLAYDTIIIDEAHERSLNIDFLLGYLKQLLPRRPDLKVIVTSATIDPQRFSEHFGGAPIIEVSGRTWPVETRYRPLDVADTDARDRDQQRAILAAVDELTAETDGDVLVFLAGEREIRETAEALRKHHPSGTEILPLYARLSAAEQQRVFEPHDRRRIVLATNVAETSLTVPGIRAVVDPGYARISRYSPRTGVQRLPIEVIAQASARQRAGRCGRLGPGVCIRLYEERDFDQREAFTAPEILRTNLAGVILQMAALKLGAVEDFPFMDPPRRAMIRDGRDTLHELGAIDEQHRLTEIGRRLARFPVDPRIGRMILAAHDEHCLEEVLVIAAALSIQDPRERPLEKADAADEAHARFTDKRSDFLALLNIWNFYHEQKKHLSWNKLRHCCREHFLSFMRMREWHDIHSQLRVVATEFGLRPNPQPAEPDAIHRALLTGLLSRIGRLDEHHAYAGPRGSTMHVFPGSGLFRTPAKWIMAAEIVETTKRYARCVARVQPEWIERAAGHLLKRSYAEPHWDPKTADVFAFERVTLFGLELVGRRRVRYGPINPATSRDLFIHHALVDGDYAHDEPFQQHNRGLLREIHEIESKRRKRDVLVDLQRQHAFFDERVGEDVVDGRSFERWRRRAERSDPRCLYMERADLVHPGAGMLDPLLYPDALAVGDLRLSLTYALEPGAPEDGVTVSVPVALLGQVPGARLEWLVPGMLEEKVVALLRGLPKSWRTMFVPAPEHAAAVMTSLEFGAGSLTDALGRALAERTGVEVPPEAWSAAAVADHLRMRVRVLDPDGAELAAGRDLEALRGQFAAEARASFARLGGDDLQRDGITSWDFDDLPSSVEVAGGLRGYPALVDTGPDVAIRLFESEAAAGAAMRGGVRRLFHLACADELSFHVEHVPARETMLVQFAALPGADRGRDLSEALALLAADRAFLDDDADIRTAAAFQARLDERWDRLWDVTLAVARLAEQVLAEHHAAAIMLEERGAPVFAETVADVRAHLAELLAPDFLLQTPYGWLAQFPRYLQGVQRRLERLRADRDAERAATMRDLWAPYVARRDDHAARGVVDPHLVHYRWMLEEMRVSLFAQELGTAVPVSEQKLAAQWRNVRA
jgi:ATP-dependent helicase HrpA